jgi:hypothetical protein
VTSTTDFFRLPNISDSFNIEWVDSLSLRRFLKTFGDATLPEILEILLQRLAQMPLPAQRTAKDQQVIFACQAFAGNTIFSQPNLHSLRIGLWNPVKFYHSSTIALNYSDFLQMSLLLLSEPHKKPAGQPLNLYQGFDLNRCNNADWHTSSAVLQAGKHPLQLWLKKKHQLCLIGHLREQNGAENFLRTNYGLLKRASAVRLGEALKRYGFRQVTSLLILHRALRDAVTRRDFHTTSPQLSDFLRLHNLYQDYLREKHELCSLDETKRRLDLLGICLRRYSSNQMQSLNQMATENGDELLDRLSNNHDPLSISIDQELQKGSKQLKIQVRQKLLKLPASKLEILCLAALGYNDCQISRHQKVAPSTVKRRREVIFQKTFEVMFQNVNFIRIAYLEVIEDYFIREITMIANGVLFECSDYSIAMLKIVKIINQKWQISLVLNEQLYQALEKIFQQEGIERIA